MTPRIRIPWVEAPPIIRAPCGSFAIAWTSESDWPSDPLTLVPSPVPEDLHRSVRRRQVEYVAGRLCAARALETQKADELVVRTAPDRSPRWPPGYCGAITHRDGFAWAVAAKLRTHGSVGIDSEMIMDKETANEIMSTIATEEELLLCPRSVSFREWITLLFSAKESAYKCLHPLLRLPRDFRDLVAVHASTNGKRAGRIDLILTERKHLVTAKYQIGSRHVNTCVIFANRRKKRPRQAAHINLSPNIIHTQCEIKEGKSKSENTIDKSRIPISK